jgi:hypothetical protein
MGRRSIFLLAALGLAGCDFPTEPPRWEQTWVVPGESVTIGVAELLPADVTLTPDGTAFRVAVPEVRVSSSLGELCPACAPLNGMVVPKPEFTATLSARAALPAELEAAVLAGGFVDMTVGHSFSFDPLRPDGDPMNRGYLAATVTSGGSEVARDSISGRDQAFPSGTNLRPSLAIQPVSVTNELGIQLRVYSPAGDPTMIRMADTLGLRVTGSFIDVSEARIRVADLSLEPTVVSMGFDLDEDVTDRIMRGAVRLEVSNPFQIEGSLTLRFDLGHGVIEKTVLIEPGTFSRRVEFSGPELRAILASADVDLVVSGSVSAPGGSVTVTPTQQLVLDASFELVILVGDTDGGE